MKIYLIAALLLATLVAVPCLAEDEAKVEAVEQVADVPEIAADGLDTPDEDTAEAKIPEELRDEVEREKRAVPQLSHRSCGILKRYGYCRNARIAKFCVRFCCNDRLSRGSCHKVKYTIKICNHNVGRVYCRRTCGQCRPSPKLKFILCEHRKGVIRCPRGRQIKINYANYGRTGRLYCSRNKPTHNQRCSSRRSNILIRRACHRRNSCLLHASNSVYGDPCRGTYKYIEVRYQCM